MNSRCRSVFQRASALMAERQGFEPWEDISPHWFSKPARSTAPAPLHSPNAKHRLPNIFALKTGVKTGGEHLGTREMIIGCAPRNPTP